MSESSPVAIIQTRDIRSASVAYKRDKDHGSKWAQGIRPLAGQKFQFPDEETYGEMLVPGKVRPANFRTDRMFKSNSTNNPKPNYRGNRTADAAGRLAQKSAALSESNDTTPLSASLLSILPQHINNTIPSIKTIQPDTLYSYDNLGPSPGRKANRVALDGLIEKAEQRWIAEQTEKMVRGEYEVLDERGETTVLKKGKRSPKQKVTNVVVDEDEGFELI